MGCSGENAGNIPPFVLQIYSLFVLLCVLFDGPLKWHSHSIHISIRDWCACFQHLSMDLMSQYILQCVWCPSTSLEDEFFWSYICLSGDVVKLFCLSFSFWYGLWLIVFCLGIVFVLVQSLFPTFFLEFWVVWIGLSVSGNWIWLYCVWGARLLWPQTSSARPRIVLLYACRPGLGLAQLVRPSLGTKCTTNIQILSLQPLSARGNQRIVFLTNQRLVLQLTNGYCVGD